MKYSIFLKMSFKNSSYSLVVYQFLNVLALNDETRLMDHLRLGVGSRYVRPVANSSDALEVKHGIALQKIDYVDTYTNVMNVNIWENYVSKETSKSENFAKIVVPSSEFKDKNLTHHRSQNSN